MIEKLQEPYLNTREDSAFRFLGLPTLMRSTGETTSGAFGLMEHWMMPPGFASPYHTHHREDEAFYVLEGEVAFVCDGNWLKGGPGTYVFGPREIPHGFKWSAGVRKGTSNAGPFPHTPIPAQAGLSG
jgi:mannose-6-phosphate isomerase-like protein (cupin superfamily)